MTAPEGIAETLGLRRTAKKPITPFGLISAIETGLSVRSLDRVASAIAPSDANFKYRIVPKATLSRRKGRDDPRLSADQSGKVARLAAVWSLAMEIWNDAEDARTFLFRVHPLLAGRRPIDLVLGTELGAQMVADILNRGRYGTAA
ncbi:MAG TPA: antitoxin Xre/MbcA/ParS toxin-binding domain-containing protein [Beijerinckiaceae bacterium]|jgi:putative toxin-antitoxin system antitoxin component (TIGR02293 family)